MSKSNSLTNPTVRQILFGSPIKDFVDSIDIPKKQPSKSKTSDKNSGPMLPLEYRDLIESRMIDKIAPKKPLLSENEVKRYHQLEEKQRQDRQPIISTSVGSPGDGLFELDTRGISKAVDEFGSKKKRADRDKELIKDAPELGELREKKEASDRNAELRADLIRNIPESIDDERERTDNLNQRYYNAGLRYISQGDTEKAEEYLKRAGLTIDEINQELGRVQADPKVEKDGQKKEGQGLEGKIKGSKNPNLGGDSEPDQANSDASSKSDEDEWEITLPSGDKMNKAMKRGLTNRDSMFTIQEALSNSILDTEDEQTRNELIKRLKNVSQVMLLNDGVPKFKVGELSEQLYDEIMKRKRDNRKASDRNQSSVMDEANQEEEPAGFTKFMQDGKEFLNYWLKMWQHPIEGEENLQLLDELKDSEPGQEPSWKELYKDWEKNNKNLIGNQNDPSSSESQPNTKKKESSATSTKLDSLETAIDELENEVNSNQKEMLENIRMEIQDMRSSGKI